MQRGYFVLQDLAGPAKRTRTFVSTTHQMGLLPLKQRALPAAPQTQSETADMPSGFQFLLSQHQRSTSATPSMPERTTSAALEQVSAVGKDVFGITGILEYISVGPHLTLQVCLRFPLSAILFFIALAAIRVLAFEGK